MATQADEQGQNGQPAPVTRQEPSRRPTSDEPFAAMIVLRASILGLVNGIPAACVVAEFGVILLGGTIALLRQETRIFAALTAPQHALAQQLKAGG
jgi:hypothetical protein